MGTEMMRGKKEEGFTLIELMIVIGIIGIIATIAIPTFSDYLHRSKRSEAFQILGSLQNGAVAYYNTEWVDRGLGGTMYTHCTVPITTPNWIPALSLNPADAGNKAFGDFASNASFSALGVNNTGMYFYRYQIQGIQGAQSLGDCGIMNSTDTNNPVPNIYHFWAVGVHKASEYESIELHNTVVDGAMIRGAGYDVTRIRI